MKNKSTRPRPVFDSPPATHRPTAPQPMTEPERKKAMDDLLKNGFQ